MLFLFQKYHTKIKTHFYTFHFISKVLNDLSRDSNYGTARRITPLNERIKNFKILHKVIVKKSCAQYQNFKAFHKMAEKKLHDIEISGHFVRLL